MLIPPGRSKGGDVRDVQRQLGLAKMNCTAGYSCFEFQDALAIAEAIEIRW
jgi:hypothetical protein